ncbi:hypothetical protein BCR44DRAFT_69037 [Catenaria anguillulae PL171]|uniref:Uncharacterized protein n=1 Tax=Catenaria anguillulae PL171 TaxID=765915 RepID=A0A1Y2HDL6_9FUNG|nr:hypothetical protein BCR44DRAFT_69037 [Catenaria anguillulae PL171]
MADESHHDGNQIAINAFRKFAADQSLSLRTEAFIPRKEVSATSLSLIQPFATHVKRNRWTRANNGDSRNRDNVSKSSAVSGHRRDQRSSHRNNGNRTKTSSNPRTSHHDGYHQRTINDRIRMQMQPQKHQLQHSDGRLFGPPTKRQDSAMSATLASQTPTPNPTAVSPGTIPFPPARASSYPRHSVPARSILKVQRQPDSLRRVTKSVQFKTGDQLEQVRRIEHVHDVMDRLPESPSDPAPTLSLFAQSHFDWEHAKGELAFAQSVVAREAKAWQDELASQQQVVSAKTNRNLELLHQLYVLKLRNLVKDKSGGVSS